MMLKIFEQLEVFYRYRRQPRMKLPCYAVVTETVKLEPITSESVYDIRATWGVRTVIKAEAEKASAIDHTRTMLARELLSDARAEVIDCLELLYAEGFRSDDPVFEKMDRLARLLGGEQIPTQSATPAENISTKSWPDNLLEHPEN